MEIQEVQSDLILNSNFRWSDTSACLHAKKTDQIERDSLKVKCIDVKNYDVKCII